jgi:hypothetical protein
MLALAVAGVASPLFADADTIGVELKALAANPAAFRNIIVRTYGWAHNTFEGTLISVACDP